MITVEKLEKGTYFDDAFKISFRYDPTTVAKVKELAERRYLPEDRAWEIPAHELPALIEKVGLSNIKSEEAVVQALNTKEIEDKREATQERLKGIKPVRDFDFKIQKNEKKRNYHLKFLTKLVRIDLRVCKKFNKHT